MFGDEDVFTGYSGPVNGEEQPKLLREWNYAHRSARWELALRQQEVKCPPIPCHLLGSVRKICLYISHQMSARAQNQSKDRRRCALHNRH